jgi:hypothetical protein
MHYSNLKVVMLLHFLLFVLAPDRGKASPTGLVAPYTSIGCWAEPENVRALVDASFASDNMTLEYCASKCSGIYEYWAVEYGREVRHPYFLPSCRNFLTMRSVIVVMHCQMGHWELQQQIVTFPALGIRARSAAQLIDYPSIVQQPPFYKRLPLFP